MGRTVILVITFGIVSMSSAHAQYHISNNEKLHLASNSEIEVADTPISTVHDFFNLAQKKQRTEWEKLLAKNCYNEGKPNEYVNQWFKQLTNHKTNYKIAEISSTKTNQKIIYYTTSKKPDDWKSIVLVKEKGQWKIFSVDL